VVASSTSPLGSTGLTVSITVDPMSAAVCTALSATLLRFDSAGTCVITGSQAGNSDFRLASLGPFGITVSPASQTITALSTPSSTVYKASYTASASVSSGLPLSISVTGVCTISGL
jgi:hypothetical protein